MDTLLSRSCVLFTTDTTCDIFMSVCVFSLVRLYTFTCNFTLAFFFFFSPFTLLSLPSLTPLGWVFDKFGGEQAERGQTRSLCVHIVEQETGWGGGGVAGR